MSALADSTNAEPLPRPAPAKKAFAEAEPRAPADGFDSQTDPSSSEPAQAADCSDAAPAPAGGGEPSEGVGSPGSSEPALVDSTDVTTRPSRPSDIAGRRDRKAVVRLEIALPEAAPLVIVAGKGKKLGEIDNVAVRIGKLPSKSDTLKRLHSFCYGRPGVATVLKKNLREFSGFDSDDKCEKMRASAGRCAAAQLREVLTLCDLELSGTKDALIERLCTWLRKPVPSSRRSLVEKAAEEKRRAEKRKRAVEKANAHAERVKKAARKAPATLPPSKGAAGPSGGDVDGFDCYVAAKLDRLQQNNPSLGKATLLEHLRGKWAALDAEKRRAFEDEAEAKNREAAALRKRALSAKAQSKEAKRGNVASRKAMMRQVAAAMMEDLDDDEEEAEMEEMEEEEEANGTAEEAQPEHDEEAEAAEAAEATETAEDARAEEEEVEDLSEDEAEEERGAKRSRGPTEEESDANAAASEPAEPTASAAAQPGSDLEADDDAALLDVEC